MCGIGGIFSVSVSAESKALIVRDMLDNMRHRGPDADGCWFDESGLVAFAHTRLSIQDISPSGAQPMLSSSERYVITYNGEVYNFPALRRTLEKSGYRFRGHSDTEVILAAIEEWGLAGSVKRFVGMFAIALWDREKRELVLVRDRLGIKPLYFQEAGHTLVFGSELKVLKSAGIGDFSIDPQALALYLRHNYIPAPYSIFESVRKLVPGSILRAWLTESGHIETSVTSYWNPAEFLGGSASPRGKSYSELVEEIEQRLEDAIRIRLVSDRPVGAFLSGGIDSSLVVALMKNCSSGLVQTFTIGFEEDGYDEAGWADAVARHLGTDHHQLYVSPEEARAVIPDLPSIFCEPFSDSSQIPTVLVSRLARQNVVVSLSGDGGDELFSGYKRYDLMIDLWRKLRVLPFSLRKLSGRALQGLSRLESRALERALDPLFRRYGRSGRLSDKLSKVAEIIDIDNPYSLYLRLVSHWKRPQDLVLNLESEPATILNSPPNWLLELDLADYMTTADLISYLPDDILVKVDRASMSIGLEARVPMLDHRIVELALQTPSEYKRWGGEAKAPLKEILGKYVPRNLIDRPKMGFGVPVGQWLRGPLRDWAIDMLSPAMMRDDRYLDPEPIQVRLKQHLDGSRDWGAYLWDVLVFQAWLHDSGRSRPNIESARESVMDASAGSALAD